MKEPTPTIELDFADDAELSDEALDALADLVVADWFRNHPQSEDGHED